MKIFRIAKKKYIDDLSGEGARLYGGRWNKRGYNMLYFSESLSLTVLEILVHLDFKYLDDNFMFLEIEIPDKYIISNLKVENLKPEWKKNPPSLYTQNIGVDWLLSKDSLGMWVPSAIIPEAYNILINPRHKDFKHLKITKTKKLNVDARVFK